jgi:mycothiol synthase
MKLTMRRYQSDDDYWRIRQFLREVFLFNERRELSWQVYRFDYWRWHGIENMGQGPLKESVFIWEQPDGTIAAVLNSESPGQAFLQVHPRLVTPDVEEEMLAVAEAHLAVSVSGDKKKLTVWASEHDQRRQALLARRGYGKGGMPEYQRPRSLFVPIPDAPVAPGYVIRSLGDAEELHKRGWVSWRAFHPDEPDEKYEGWEWYRNIQRTPLYRRDLDLVAVAPGGEFASFCTAWFDDVTRTGAFEPVGTAPEHQRLGIGKATMLEGLRRLKALGVTLVYVGSFTPGAHALYESVGFTEYELSQRWEREFRME